MQISKIIQAFFSPAGTTEKLVTTAAATLAAALSLPVETADFTQPAGREHELNVPSDALLVVGVPVYAGRVPNKLLPFVHEKIRGDQSPAIALVSYGNRSFGDGLSELVAELKGNGFCPVAAGAFVCQHSIIPTLAAGRPNEEDLSELRDLASRAALRIRKLGGTQELLSPTVDGNTPPGPYYRPLELDGTPANFLKAKPKTDPEKCVNCGLCARVCSMGAIDPENVALVPGLCIKCQACVRRCPQGAKYFDDPSLLSHTKMVETNNREPKTNSVYVF